VYRPSLWKILTYYGISDRFINIFKAPYVNSSCCAKTASGYREFFEIVSGVRQDCIFSPFLFIIVINFVMRRTIDKPKYGIVWQKQNRLTDLEEKNVCQEITTKLEEQSAQVGLNISREKNEGHGSHPALITTANRRCTRQRQRRHAPTGAKARCSSPFIRPLSS